MILSRPLVLKFVYCTCIYAGGNRLSNVPTMNTVPPGKKNVFSPLHLHVESIFPSTVALLQLEEKLVLHAGEEGERIFLL